MRLLIVTFLLLSVAGVFGRTQQQAIETINSLHRDYYESIKNVVNFVAQQHSKGLKTLGDPTICTNQYQSTFSSLGNDPNCKALFGDFAANPLGNASTDATSVPRFLDLICTNPCYMNLVNGLKSLITCINTNGDPGVGFNFTSLDAIFGLFCMKNPANGQYCLALMTDPALLNITGGGKADNATACNAFAQFGCCMTPIFSFIPDPRSIQSVLKTACGFSLPPACPRPGESVHLVKATWTIKGLAYAYFIANKATVSNALRADIATALSCDPGFISFTDFRQGSVIADFNVRGNSDTQTDSLGTAVTTAAGQTQTFPTVAATVGTAGLDSGATLGIDPSKSSSSVTTYTAPGSGTNVQPMFALVAGLLAFAVFARQ